MRLLVLLFLFTSPLFSQTSGLENLDSKYGFNKFRLEDPLSKYSGEVKYNGKRDYDNVDLYRYNGPKINKIFGYFSPEYINLEFYKKQLSHININFGKLTQANNEFIYRELIKLFGYPQKELNQDETLNFGYFWTSDKTNLLFMDYRKTGVVIEISSNRMLTKINNDKF